MSSWRVFMSPSRDISNSQDFKQHSYSKENEQQSKYRLTKPNLSKIIYNTRESSQQNINKQKTNQLSVLFQQQINNKKSIKPTKTTNKKQNTLTRQAKELQVSPQIYQTKQKPGIYIQKQLIVHNKSTNRNQANIAFLQSTPVQTGADEDFNMLDNIQVIDDRETMNYDMVESNQLMQKDLSNIKGLMMNNNEMIKMLSIKLDSFQKEQDSLQVLKRQLSQEQRTKRKIDHKIDEFSNRLTRIDKIVKRQQRQLYEQQQEIKDHKRRYMESAEKIPKYSLSHTLNETQMQQHYSNILRQRVMTEKQTNHKEKKINNLSQGHPTARILNQNKIFSQSQIIKRNYPDLQHAKQTICKALQEVYYQYLDG